jgi:hypothetical protein
MVVLLYSSLAMGQLAARQAELESESKNIASDNASVIQTLQEMADT